MSVSQLKATTAHYRAALRAHEHQAEQALAYAHEQTLMLIEPQLDTLYRAISEALDKGEAVPLSWLYEQDRLTTIARMIERQINQFGALSQLQVLQLQQQGAYLGVQAGNALLKATLPAGVQFAFGIPSPGAIVSMVGATQAGSPLADLFAGFGSEAAQYARTALIGGVTLGWNPREIAPQVQKALDISRQRALTIARTEMLRSYREANLETFRANSDVVSGWRWTATLGANTCAACLAMDGEIFALGDSMDSHVNCRCVETPITKSWEDILSGTGIDTSDIPETSGAEDMQTGADWFAQQDEATQRQVLGKAGYDLYASGTPLKDFVGTTSDPVWGSSIYQKPVKELIH